MKNLILLILGIIISAIGILNIRGNIGTVHSYNRKKVKEEDIPKYGKVIGIGTLIIGISVILAYVLAFWKEEYTAYAITPGVIIGLAFILYGQFKYNRGLF